MNHSPQISVIMSVYNREKYVSQAIESILNQTFNDFEFIIIDDCSTDNSTQIIENYSLKDSRIIFEKNKKNMGLIYSLNKGLKLARGKYIARMDDDDISLPERFEKQFNYLENNPQIMVLGTFFDLFGNPNAIKWKIPSSSDFLNISINFHNPIIHPSAMIRKSFLEKHNICYSSTSLHAEDYRLWADIVLHGGKLANLPEPLISLRIHENRISSTKDTLKIMDKSAEAIRKELLCRFFNKTTSTQICNTIKKWPFESNNKKQLFTILEKMKGHSNIISDKIISEFQEEYCGKACTMDIFFASDNKYSKHLCVALTSILVNALPYERHNFYILNGGISSKNKSKIKQVRKIKDCHIEFIDIDDSLFHNCPLSISYISKSTYYRYIIPLVKPDLNKAFYFDCDIIVHDSLNKFWNTDITDYYIAASEELWIKAHNYYKSMGINNSFNAGILLINLEKWKKDHITSKLFEKTIQLSKQSSLLFQDQDILNVVCNGRVYFVSPKWNLQQTAFFDGQHSLFSDDEMNISKHYPIIIHYSGSIKPWHSGCLHPLWKIYNQYLKISPFKNIYFEQYLKNILNNIKKIFYSKKKKGAKTTIRILGLELYKCIRDDYKKNRYFCGIKYSSSFDIKGYIDNKCDYIVSQINKQS